jgi:hypothetical protein
MEYFESLNKPSFKSTKRLMSAEKCSDTFKDVIRSLINENLLSYSNYYDSFMDINKADLTSNTDSDSMNYTTNNVNLSIDNFNKSDKIRKSALKYGNKKLSKNLMFCDTVENSQKKCIYHCFLLD